MKKILILRDKGSGALGGIQNYCSALEKIFAGSADFEMLPSEQCSQKPSRLFHGSYETAPLKKAISQADIVHVNGYTSLGTAQALFFALRYKKAVVYSPHWHPFARLAHPLLGKLFFYVFIRPQLSRVHTIVTINNEDSAFFSTFHKNVVKIPHFASITLPWQMPQKTAGMILFVGRLNDKVKGTHHLEHIPQGKYAIHCVGAGTMPDRDDFIQHTNISAQALSTLYAQASLLVVPSKYEAFSYVTLEALLHGTPVVMSDRVRIADYLEGIDGYSVFRYGDYDGFVEAIEKTIGKKVDTEKIKALFSMEAIRDKYRSVYLNANKDAK